MRDRRPASLLVLYVALVLVAAGCATRGRGVDGSSSGDTAGAQKSTVIAKLAPTQGNHVSGTVTFIEENGSIRVVTNLSGVPQGLHGFHIHEKGDCSAPDGSSAGGHFNPFGHDHGPPEAGADRRHVGDLGNIDAAGDGKVHVERTDKLLSLEGEASIVGKSVIVHANADDLTTQPTGNAGGRIACGVIMRMPLESAH